MSLFKNIRNVCLPRKVIRDHKRQQVGGRNVWNVWDFINQGGEMCGTFCLKILEFVISRIHRETQITCDLCWFNWNRRSFDKAMPFPGHVMIYHLCWYQTLKLVFLSRQKRQSVFTDTDQASYCYHSHTLDPLAFLTNHFIHTLAFLRNSENLIRAPAPSLFILQI